MSTAIHQLYEFPQSPTYFMNVKGLLQIDYFCQMHRSHGKCRCLYYGLTTSLHVSYLTLRVSLGCWKLTILLLLIFESLFVPVFGGQRIRICHPDKPVTCQYGGTCTKVKLFSGNWHKLLYFRRKHPGVNPFNIHMCKCPQINCHKSGFRFQCGSDGR